MANNRVQQRFDKGIRDAVEQARAANDAKPRRRIFVSPSAPEKAQKGRLYLCPETGATVWEPERRHIAEPILCP
jgi:hypothetical protein